MCFSAAASFTTSAVLGVAGAHTMSRSKTKQDVLLATIPVIFSLQQLFEGLVWVLPGGSRAGLLAAYVFLFFAFLFWPFYIPLACYVHEINKKRQNILGWFVLLGGIGSAYLFLALFVNPLQVVEVNNSIQYAIDIPFETIGISLYIAVTVGALLIATHPFLKIFGFIVVISAWLSWIFYSLTFTSVWCFFSAIFSILIWVHILKPHWADATQRLVK